MLGELSNKLAVADTTTNYSPQIHTTPVALCSKVNIMWPRPAHPIGDTAVTHHTGKRGVVSRRSSWRFRCNDVSWGTTRENRKAFHHRQILPRLRDPINKTALVYRSRPNTYVDLFINTSICVRECYHDQHLNRAKDRYNDIFVNYINYNDNTPMSTSFPTWK